jgi:coenzyme Q-binding protein COQ10
VPTHAEKRLVPYRAEQIFDLVADIERYPEFLPWCRAVRVVKREGNSIDADMAIGFKMFSERFRSQVRLDRKASRIDVTFVQGPFKYLTNHWEFIPREGGQCVIDFFVDFEFQSRLLQRAIELLFNEAVKRMVAAFEGRAHALYGADAADAGGKPGLPG